MSELGSYENGRQLSRRTIGRDGQSTVSDARPAQRVRRAPSLAKLGLALLLVASFLGCGPSDECGEGAQRCDGNVAMRCETSADDPAGHRFWSRTDCAGGCREFGDNAFCLLEAGPNPKCLTDASHASSGYCEADVAVNCIGGYVIERVDCALSWSNPSPAQDRCIEFEHKSASCQSSAGASRD